MSLNELERVKSIAIAQRQYLIVWCSIFIWDTLCTLRLEQRVIWKARWTLMKALYLLNRYGSLMICIASWITVFVPMSNATCSKVLWIQLTEVVYVLLVTHSILSVRLYAIFDKNRYLRWGLILWLMMETSFAIAAMTIIQSLNLPRPIAKYIELEGCFTSRKPGSPNLSVGLQVIISVFDTAVLLSVAGKHWQTTRRVGQRIPLLQRLLFDGAIYYIVITAAHLTTALMWYLGDVSVKAFNVPCSVVLSSLACSRLVLSLKGRPQTQPVVGSLPSVKSKFREPPPEQAKAVSHST